MYASDLLILTMAQVIGFYSLATILMIKLTLPPSYRIVISEILSGLNLNFFGQWFERLFVLSSIISIIYLKTVR